MFIDAFESSDAAKSIRRDAIARLFQSGFIGVLLELRSMRSQLKASNIDHSALQGAYGDGYYQAIRDLLTFGEVSDEAATNRSVTPDYGALDRLVTEGTITREEAEALRTTKR